MCVYILFHYLLLEDIEYSSCAIYYVLIVYFICSCPVFPEPFIEDAFFAPLYIFASFVKNKVTIVAWRRQWQPTPELLPRKSHERRSLVGCGPWGRSESDRNERLHFHFSLSCIGEGNGNPLQCSCLENPRDREAWWAAVYGVTQSQK